MKYNRIKDLARAKKIKIEDLALRIGMTAPGFHKMFKRQTLSVSNLERISRHLEVPMTYWFEEDKSMLNEQLIEYKQQNEGTIAELRSDLKYFRERCIALEKENNELKADCGKEAKKTG